MKRILAGVLLTIGMAFAQPAFDVVSIKPGDPMSNMVHIGIGPSGSFEASGVNLMTLVAQAYDVRGFQIVGGIGWMNDEKYTIVTKDEAASPTERELAAMDDAHRNQFREQMMAKVRTMLADRFRLKIHRETKEMPVYALTVSKGGLRMQVSPEDGRNDMGLNMSRTDEAKAGVTGKKVPMDVLTRFLSNQVSRTVVDRTALTGKYDFRLVFSPDLGDTAGPSIFTALQEQLGLKLEAEKGPVEVVVIDGAEKPSEN
ncbi:MAG TPA: TIGR03435 family protein [Bryobacteraceae bacterium]|nr:TIGR03435 family protein [Bryobacteraceae bacterium]